MGTAETPRLCDFRGKEWGLCSGARGKSLRRLGPLHGPENGLGLSMAVASASCLLLVLTVEALQLLPEIAFCRLPHGLYAVVNLPLAGLLVVPRLLLAQFEMIEPDEFHMAGIVYPLPLLGLELPFLPLLELPRGAGG